MGPVCTPCWLPLAWLLWASLAPVAQAQPVCETPCGRMLVIQPSVGAGVQVGRAYTHYEPTDDPEQPGLRDDEADGPRFATELRLVLGAQLGRHIALGGFFAFMPTGEPPHAIVGVRRRRASLLGAELAVTQAPNHGVFASLRAGPAWVDGHLGSAFGLGAGYLWLLTQHVSLSTAVECTRLSFKHREDGDFGNYRYETGVWTPALSVGLRVL